MDLYRRLLPEAWDDLPEPVKIAHSVPLQAEGVMDVARPPGRLANLFADMTRLPRAGQQQRVLLQVDTVGGRARWRRSFNGLDYPASLQWSDDRMLFEQCGPMRLGFSLLQEGGRLVYEQRRFWLLGVPLPMACALRVRAIVAPAEQGWWVEVAISAPLIGLLCRYAGNMRPV